MLIETRILSHCKLYAGSSWELYNRKLSPFLDTRNWQGIAPSSAVVRGAAGKSCNRWHWIILLVFVGPERWAEIEGVSSRTLITCTGGAPNFLWLRVLQKSPEGRIAGFCQRRCIILFKESNLFRRAPLVEAVKTRDRYAEITRGKQYSSLSPYSD